MPPDTSHSVHPASCSLCGCGCDDLTVVVDGQAVQSVDRACEPARQWFKSSTPEPAGRPTVEGEAVSFESAIESAAAIFRTAKRPLITGLGESGTAGQRAACEFADRLGAIIDPLSSQLSKATTLAMQRVGKSTCTLGEVRNRADLVIYWGSNPILSHPRHLERFVRSTEHESSISPGRCKVVVVDPDPTETAAVADHAFPVSAGRDLELITDLRRLIRGQTPDFNTDIGLSEPNIRLLAQLMQSANYGMIFFGQGLTSSPLSHLRVEALSQLVTELNAQTRFVMREMRGLGNAQPGDQVLCWQSGYPFSVDFSRGYPRYRPDEYRVENLLCEQAVDAVLIIGTTGLQQLSSPAREELNKVPTVLINLDSRAEQADENQKRFVANVEIPVGTYGLHCTGIQYRMDEVPIPQHQVFQSSQWTDAMVISEILKRMNS